jgi:titin
MPSRNRNMQGGKSVVSDLAPRTIRTGSGQINDNWVGVFPPMPIPTFGSVTATSGGWAVSITNYDSAATYVVTTTAGSVSQLSGTITQSGLGNNTSATVTVTVSKTGYSSSIAVIAGTSQSQLAAPTFSASTGTSGGWTATITNYDAANTYSLSTTAGSASQTSGTITQSGLGNNTSSTVTVTVSRSGYVSNSGTISGTSQSQLTAPTFSGSTATAGGWTATITNYDSSATYSISTTSGSASQTSGTITQSGLGNGVSTTVTATVSKSGFVSNSGTVSGTSQSQLATPTFSAYSYTTANGGFQFTITNYNASYTYNLSTTAGSISRSGSTVTVSGLSNGQTATAYVSASLAGYVTSAQGSITGMAKPTCTSCGTGTTSVEGCNGATCGIIACPSGYCPAYNIVYYNSPSPNPCVGCNASIGGWYCCGCGGVCG